MTTPRAPRPTPTWTFAARFRRGAFGWKSDLAIQRLDEAAAVIWVMARKDPALAADGAVRLFEKLSPAFENVDDSSGRLQAVIRDVIEQFVPLVGSVEVAPKTRQAWLDRLWQAMTDDQMPWIERLGDHWGTLCGSPEAASAWADELLPRPAQRLGTGRGGPWLVCRHRALPVQPVRGRPPRRVAGAARVSPDP